MVFNKVGRKLRRIKTLLNNRTKIKNSFDLIVYEEKIQQIIEKYNKSELKSILPAELFKHLDNYSLKESIDLFTDFMNGNSPVIDYFFLCHTAKALKIENYFEIGTWVGLSAHNISLNSERGANIYTLDIPFDHPEIKAYNIPVNIFGYHSRDITNINHLKGDSMNFDFSPYNGKMDLVFVDGNHSLDYVANDSRKAFEMLKHERSIILWHDYLMEGNINKNVLCGILEGIPESEHRHLFYIYQSNMAVYCRKIDFVPRV